MRRQRWYKSLHFENSSHAPMIASRTAKKCSLNQIRSPAQVLHPWSHAWNQNLPKEKKTRPPLWACKCGEGGGGREEDEEEREGGTRGGVERKTASAYQERGQSSENLTSVAFRS